MSLDSGQIMSSHSQEILSPARLNHSSTEWGEELIHDVHNYRTFFLSKILVCGSAMLRMLME